MEFSCEQIGLSQDELQERIISAMSDRLLSRLLRKYVIDDEDNSKYSTSTELHKRLDALVKSRMETAINTIADRVLEPMLSKMIYDQVLTPTNKWGEAKGEQVTFTEYMVARAEAYMTEDVNRDGKNKSALRESSYSFVPYSTRLGYHVEKSLASEIKCAMEKVINAGNKTLAQALTDAVRIQIEQLIKKTTVKIETK